MRRHFRGVNCGTRCIFCPSARGRTSRIEQRGCFRGRLQTAHA
nr:MAG TPA: hypothetical protein [Caudoviricetes sp.]